jgi:hypothetical protein
MSNDNDLNPASERGAGLPWPTVTADNWHDRIYDHGAHWCNRRDQHPAPADGHPGPDHYRAECRTSGGQFRDGRLDTHGHPIVIEAYAARPFLFGQLRENPAAPQDGDARLVISAVAEREPDTAAVRISLPITETRNLAYHLLHLADVIDGHIPPGPSATPVHPNGCWDDKP